jgi:hypothetical protein
MDLMRDISPHRLWVLVLISIHFMVKNVNAQRSVVELESSMSATTYATNAAPAHGLAVVDLNGGSISYSIAVTGLTGSIIAAHFHLKSSGKIVQTVCGNLSPCTGSYLNGMWINPSAYLADFAAHNIYVDFHTVINPDGELQGYIALPQRAGPDPIVASFLEGPTEGKAIAKLSYNAHGGLDYDFVAAGLSAPVTKAHFHLGAAGAAGDVLFTVCDPCDGAALKGTWPGAKDYMSVLADGDVYIDLHTASFPDGEIRAQAAVPAMPARRAVVVLAPAAPTAPPRAYGLAVVDAYGAALRFELVAAGLTGPITAAHFHSKTTGAVVFSICGGGSGGGGGRAIPCAGDFLAGTWPDASQYLPALAAGGVYVNVHTSAFPAGEIKGHVTLPAGLYPAVASGLVPAAGSAGRGVAELVLNGDGGLDYAAVAAGLSGPVTRAHFHLGAAGAAGDVLFTVCDPCDGGPAAFEGTWPGAKDYLGVLAGAGVYLNLHTARFPAGEVRGQAQVVATACRPLAGQHCPPGAFTPTLCPAGTFSHGRAATGTACRGCEAGKYSTVVGSPREASCTGCPAGTYASAAGASSLAACVLCAGGKYAHAASSQRCWAVRRGGYGVPGASRPTPCPVDHYCPEDGLAAPVPCPAGESTLGWTGRLLCTVHLA